MDPLPDPKTYLPACPDCTSGDSLPDEYVCAKCSGAIVVCDCCHVCVKGCECGTCKPGEYMNHDDEGAAVDAR